MFSPMKLAAIALLALSASTLLAQDNAVVCIDATNERNVIVAPSLQFGGPNTTCPLATPGAHLVQGRRNQLRIVNRKFLSDYSFIIDGTTSLPEGRIQDLNEAANLTIPLSSTSSAVSKGAAPKGLAVGGTLTLRTAQDLISELSNPTTSSNPASEIESDWLFVQGEIKRMQVDRLTFDGLWNPLTTPVPVGVNPCLSAYGDPNFQSAQACLLQTIGFANTGTFTTPPFTNEDEFRKLLVLDSDAMTMVTALGAKLNLQAPQLATHFTSLDGDIMQFRIDANILAGNIQAATDAANLVENLPPELSRAEIKARLVQSLNGSKTVLDPTELNYLSQELFQEASTGEGRRVLGADAAALRGVNDTVAAEFARVPKAGCSPRVGFDARTVNACSLGLGTFFKGKLDAESADLFTTLPQLTDSINGQQSTLLERTNFIYDDSRVDVPLDKIIDLSSTPGNLYVYFTVRRIDAFARFVVPPLTVGGSAPSTPAVVPTATASTTATAPSTTTSTVSSSTTTTTTTTTTSPAASASSGTTTGSVVAHGQIEVHDVYNAVVVAAFAFSWAHESVQTTTVTTGTSTDGTNTLCGSATATPPANCSQPSAGAHHSSVIMGLDYHLRPYDTFPMAERWGRRGTFLSKSAIFGGLSVQNLNDYYFGYDLEVVSGVQIMGGMNIYRQNMLATGYKLGTIYAGTPNFTGPMGWSKGAYFGIGLNLSIFRKIYGAATGLSTSTTSTGGGSTNSTGSSN